MTLLDNQLKEHSVELTVVSYCFLILLIPMLWFIPAGSNAILSTMVDAGYTSEAVFRSYEVTVIALGLNLVGYLLSPLVIWFLLNAVQLVCLYFDRGLLKR